MFVLTKIYSDEIKLTVVKEYQEGKLGIRPLAKKYGIKSKSQVGRWIKLYERFGEDGLLRKKKKPYSVHFKLDVLSFMKRTGSSEMETALHFGITNPSIIATWKKSMKRELAGDLNTIRKGLPPMPKSRKNETRTKEELARENELLRLEVEYLKKLRAFQMDPEGYLEKHKQQYHSNSKKPSH